MTTVQASCKQQIAELLQAMMFKQRISQSELARRMRTSRAIVSRLLQPDDLSMTLTTFANALDALNVRCRIVIPREEVRRVGRELRAKRDALHGVRRRRTRKRNM
jgi:transcriptional regulator with XRE-family HTH domain